jgi:hypothetical protein
MITVRVQHSDRLLTDGRKLGAALDAAPVLSEITFERPASNGRKARTVHQQLKAVRVRGNGDRQRFLLD